MTALEARLEREDRLAQFDVILSLTPNRIGTRFRRACLLEEIDRADDALADYHAILARDRSHAGALTNLGSLLYRRRFRRAARAAFVLCVARHPRSAIARVNLAKMLVEDGALHAARAHLTIATEIDPAFAEAHLTLAAVAGADGDATAAAAHRDAALRVRPVTVTRYRGTGSPVRVLLVATADNGNVALGPVLDDRVFELKALAVERFDPQMPVPLHDVAFNLIGDADRCASALNAAATLLERTAAPVLNPPAIVSQTGRAAQAARLAGIPGVVTPSIVSFARRDLHGPGGAARLEAAGFSWPLLLRSPGHHNGEHFVYVTAAADLPDAVGALPGDELLAIELLDARGPDGRVRKYRVMIVDGALYPLHVAISAAWKVHYATADMAERADHRAEDAGFLTDMRRVLGGPAMTALEHIRVALELDYGGVDFGLDSAGRVLLFEANATMVVPAPEADERWAYRRMPVRRIHDAIRAMVVKRAGFAAAGGR